MRCWIHIIYSIMYICDIQVGFSWRTGFTHEHCCEQQQQQLDDVHTCRYIVAGTMIMPQPPRKRVYIGTMLVWCYCCCCCCCLIPPPALSSSAPSSYTLSCSRVSESNPLNKTPQQQHHQHQQPNIGDDHGHATAPTERLPPQLLLPTMTAAKSAVLALRGGVYFARRMHTFSRKGAWETAVKRGKGGFPAPSSWEPMDEEELRIMAENLLTPEVENECLELLPGAPSSTRSV